jgi:pyruvate/2-oxoglutarate/acetoin dehydrogenase E1 component
VFQYLDAPIKRVGALDVPVPFAPTLEDFVLPNTLKVVVALRELCEF